jgi:hypothetical protein
MRPVLLRSCVVAAFAVAFAFGAPKHAFGQG